MTYNPINWQPGPGGGTPMSAANFAIMDSAIDTLDDTVNNSTGNEAATLPATNGPFTFVNWLGYLLTQLKAIIGGAHWYTAPPASLTSLNTAMATKLSTTGTAADSAKLGGVAAANFPQRGSHNAVAGFTVSMGDGPPVSLAANEVYIQRS